MDAIELMRRQRAQSEFDDMVNRFEAACDRAEIIIENRTKYNLKDNIFSFNAYKCSTKMAIRGAEKAFETEISPAYYTLRFLVEAGIEQIDNWCENKEDERYE